MPDKNHCITLKDRPDVTKYVETLLKDYSKEPQNTRFDGIISPPSSTRNISKVFVWCPISHYDLKITCHRHNKVFAGWRWTDDFVNPVSGYNPRMAYYLFGNVLIIQRIYT